MALFALEKYDKASKYCDKTLELDLLYEDALGSYDNVLEHEVNDGAVWRNKGHVLYELNRYKKL